MATTVQEINVPTTGKDYDGFTAITSPSLLSKMITDIIDLPDGTAVEIGYGTGAHRRPIITISINRHAYLMTYEVTEFAIKLISDTLAETKKNTGGTLDMMEHLVAGLQTCLDESRAKGNPQ